ncbi:MAG: DUF2085 domain-containing protein [Pyrinomonadaceae bacterium]
MAKRFWIGLTVLFSVWVLLIIAPAILGIYGNESLGSPLYGFFSNICHQLPERTFHLMGHPLGVCSRCFGVYLGLVVGALFYPLFRKLDDAEPLPLYGLILAIIPMGVDWALTFFGIWENTFTTRFLTGSLLGIACAVYILPALSELSYFIHARRSRTARTD